MPTPRSISRGALAVLTAALLLPAQDGLRLSRVPDRIVLPPPSGTNLLLEVALTAAPTQVWLARSRDQIGGVPLDPSGDGTWQLNLADPRVLRLLPADRSDGTFRVFARVAGSVLESAEIAWSRGELATARVKCVAIGVDGSTREGSADQVRWLDPSRIERLELRGTAAPQARVTARAGTTDLPVDYRRDDQLFVLELNDGLRRDMQAAGRLLLEVRVGLETLQFDYRIVPDRLEPQDEPGFVVRQRRHAAVPGSLGWLEVRLDDITGGRVLLAMVDAEDGVVIAPRLIGEREGVEFALAGARYVLRIDQLVNQVIGEDHAELSVVPAAKFEPDRIALLIARVEAATTITFVREGVDYNSAAAARLLRARLGSHRGKPPTPAEFAVMAGTSTTTGKPYTVELASGEVIPAPQWLEQLFGEIERELQAARAPARK